MLKQHHVRSRNQHRRRVRGTRQYGAHRAQHWCPERDAEREAVIRIVHGYGSGNQNRAQVTADRERFACVTRASGKIVHVDQFTSVDPFRGVKEPFGINVRAHGLGSTIQELNVTLGKPLVKLTDANAVGAANGAHVRVTARGHDTNHGTVVFLECQDNFAFEENVKQYEARYAKHAKRVGGCDDFCFRRGVAYSSLTLAKSHQRIVGVGADHT